jgi:hypothetical protein
MNTVPAIAPALATPAPYPTGRVRSLTAPQAPLARWAWWRRLGLGVLPWLVLTIIYVPGSLIFDSRSPQPDGWRYIVFNYLTCFMIWALYTPVIGWLWRIHPLTWPPRFRAALAHVSCAMAMVSIHALLMAGFDVVLPPGGAALPYVQNVIRLFVIRMPLALVLYAGTTLCFAAWDAFKRYHERERSLAHAQLDALKAQIEPHFLFNTLNAVSELVYRDPAGADRVITQLAKLLRQFVDRREHEQSLREELAMLREYVSIQQILLGARLRAHWQVADELLDVQVPTLLLQPIYENAIRHGIAQLRHGGSVTLAVGIYQDRLVLSVQNDGPALAGKTLVDGLGLENTRARLHALYASAQSLVLEFPDSGGARVTIELPLHRSHHS